MAVAAECRQVMPVEFLEASFSVQVDPPPGSTLRLVGSLSELGAWNPDDGVELRTSAEAHPRWSVTTRLPAQAFAQGVVEYKFVLLRPGAPATWEECPNRQLSSQASFSSHIFGEEDRWGTPPMKQPEPLGECNVIFEANCPHTLPGDCLLIIGAAEPLGAWDPSRALRLTTMPSMFPFWCGAASFPTDMSLGAWKLAILRGDGFLDWEHGQDRETSLPATSEEVRIVHAHFGATDEEGARRAEVATFSELGCLYDCLQASGPGFPIRKALEEDFELALDHKHSTRRSSTDSTASTCTSEDLERKDFVRPSSTVSTASTCTSEEDRDVFLEAKPFSDQVFEGLFGVDLRQRLLGHVEPAAPAHEGNENARQLWLWTGAHRVQKPCGRCEDAYFHNSYSLGVADGVGSMVQFAKHGADAAAYAAGLMESAEAALAKPAARTDVRPDFRAQKAIAAAEAEAWTYGASTIAVLALEGDKVGIANLGDSGFLLLRKAPEGVVIAARTREQQHSWNCPYQLVRLPPALKDRLPKGGPAFDTAEDCQRYVMQVKPGDLLLLFTDGMCDNLHDSEILQIANRALAPALSDVAGLAGFATSPDLVARALALAAQERSLDDSASVPFWEVARSQGMDCSLGGKPDDITVVAAWVMPEVCD